MSDIAERGRAERKETARWAVLAKEPGWRGGWSENRGITFGDPIRGTLQILNKPIWVMFISPQFLQKASFLRNFG
jgi:hypothetical protein